MMDNRYLSMLMNRSANIHRLIYKTSIRPLLPLIGMVLVSLSFYLSLSPFYRVSYCSSGNLLVFYSSSSFKVRRPDICGYVEINKLYLKTFSLYWLITTLPSVYFASRDDELMIFYSTLGQAISTIIILSEYEHYVKLPERRPDYNLPLYINL
jgi:hypothetical protein